VLTEAISYVARLLQIDKGHRRDRSLQKTTKDYEQNKSWTQMKSDNVPNEGSEANTNLSANVTLITAPRHLTSVPSFLRNGALILHSSILNLEAVICPVNVGSDLPE
jgi:hypothetical protein